LKDEYKDQLSEVRSARDAKQRENRLLWVVSLLGQPFIVLAIFRQSPNTIKILQAYLLTALVFGALIFLHKRPEINKWWFWKAIGTGFLIHLAVLTGLFYWDNLNPQAAGKTFLLIGLLYVSGMVDLFIILVIIEHFRPDDATEDKRVQ
jgi:hypothetical protein